MVALMETSQDRYQQYLKQARLFRAKVRSLAKAGHSQTDIGKHLGVSRQRINQILNATAHRARTAIGLAVKLKMIPKASTQKCVDCGVRATQYDHRDYTQRLGVEPVCEKCNHKRGRGLNGGKFSRPPGRKLTMALIKNMKMHIKKISTMGGEAKAAKRKSKL